MVKGYNILKPEAEQDLARSTLIHCLRVKSIGTGSHNLQRSVLDQIRSTGLQLTMICVPCFVLQFCSKTERQPFLLPYLKCQTI